MDQVLADVKAVQGFLHSCGARWIEDYSPNGGRHVYIPLEERVVFSEARDFVEALGTRYRSLDKSPHQNIHHGCVRTPGSVHKHGGHQQLAMSLNVAYDVARRPNTPGVWARLTSELAREISAVRELRSAQLAPESSAAAEVATGVATRRMSRAMTNVALTGLYDANRYSSPSEARQAVLVSAAAAGLSLLDVQRRIHQGIWPGMASFYAKYRTDARSAALKREWDKALRHVQKDPGEKPGKSNVRKSTTSGLSTQGALLLGVSVSSNPDAEHRYVRTWRNALQLREHRYAGTRDGLGKRMVLRALGEAAHMTASRFVEFGSRSIAVATGMHHTTVQVHLQELRVEKNSLVTLVEQGRGTKGDMYMLTIPEEVKAAAEDMAWRKGKIHALRPVFRELGLPAAFVYEALEHSPGLRTGELVRATGLSRTAVTEALEVLAAWNMITRGTTLQWAVVATTSLRDLAEHFGVLEAVAAQIKKYQQDRIIWREWLSKRAHTVAELLSPTEDYPWHANEGPPEEWTLTHMAFKQLA